MSGLRSVRSHPAGRGFGGYLTMWSPGVIGSGSRHSWQVPVPLQLEQVELGPPWPWPVPTQCLHQSESPQPLHFVMTDPYPVTKAVSAWAGPAAGATG